jgi:hypothetical protein
MPFIFKLCNPDARPGVATAMAIFEAVISLSVIVSATYNLQAQLRHFQTKQVMNMQFCEGQ